MFNTLKEFHLFRIIFYGVLFLCNSFDGGEVVWGLRTFNDGGYMLINSKVVFQSVFYIYGLSIKAFVLIESENGKR